MEEIEIDPDDLDELEAKLYAQQHHDAVETLGQGLNTLFNSLDPENLEEAPQSCRYWNKGIGGVAPNPRYSKINFNPCAVRSEDSEEVEASLDVAPFRPYMPYLNYSGAVPDASGEGPKPEGSNDIFKKDESNDEKRKKGNKEPQSSNRIINEKMTKLDKNMKMQMKKFKANLTRQKSRNRNIETIVIDSSGDESDIVEIPMPAPPMVNLDSSTESEEEEKPKESKTELLLESKSKKSGQRNSHCNSPNSVVSDDFIAHADQTRLLEENVPDDEDLVCIQETVDLVCQNQAKKVKSSHLDSPKTQEENEVEKAPNFVTPRKKLCKNMTSTPNYQVTQSCFRATDVYESESSDMPESVYSKVRAKGKEKPIQVDSNSDDEVEISYPKAKRLRKRKASGSNKESEHNDDSSDAEDDENPKQSLPFIGRGEAVENNKEKLRRRSKCSRTKPISDTDFITIINKISRGKNSNESASDISIHSEEELTAREIAEDVLNKKKKVKRASKKPEAQPEAEVHKENDDAIPETSLSNVERVLEKIDVLYKDKETSAINSEAEEHVTSEEDEVSALDSIIEQKIQISAKSSAKIKKQQVENQLSVVFANNLDFGWSEEMKRFYRDSWGQEHYNVSRIKKTMDPTSKWTVYTQDRITKISKFSRLKCFNCCEYGHHRSKCPLPKRPLICSMCGETGHREPRCPYTCCLRCGNKTRVYTKSCNECSTHNKLICPICKIRGHNVQTCPDKWRRYHSTTKVNEYPSSKLIVNKRKFCCICAGHGHLSEHCRSALRFLEYPPSVSEIRSYAKSYEDVLIKNSLGKDVIGYNLLYEPDDKISFRFTKNVTLKQCYGRFLKAVDLSHLLPKQVKPINENESGAIDVSRNIVVNPFANDQKLLSKLSTKKEKLDQNCSTKITDDIVLNVSTNESNFKLPEPPKMMKTNSPVIQEHTDTLIETPTLIQTSVEEMKSPDSNSNYSFSEHFDEQGKSIRKLGSLPDYIPLGDDDDVQDDLAQSTFSESVIGVSKKLNQEINTSVSEDEKNTKNICEAKIYLTKFHSRYLLSPDGTKLLADMSIAYQVKANIDWTSVGNTLIIAGDSAKQDAFHKELLEVFRNLSDDLKRKELERSQRLPRKKETLIRFLQENILQLENNLGNVRVIYDRLKSCRSHYTKSSWKLAEKLRRSLNMILIGQAGLNNGKEFLETLQNQLKNLINDTTMTTLPENLRNEIEKVWRIIFTSQQQCNYDSLIETYKELKKKNQLSKPTLNYSVLGKKVVNVTLTNEQKHKMGKKELPVQPESKKISAFNLMSIKTEQQIDNKSEESVPNFNSAVGQQIMEGNKRWENQSQNLPNGLDETRNPRRGIFNNKPSMFWSQECINFIERCLRVHTGKNPLRVKLTRVRQKARKGLLSYNDYRVLVRIYNAIIKRTN